MFFDRFTFAYWLKIGHPDLWITGMIAVLTALVTLLSVSIAAYLTYRYTKKHSIETHNTQILGDRLQREISALEKVNQSYQATHHPPLPVSTIQTDISSRIQNVFHEKHFAASGGA